MSIRPVADCVRQAAQRVAKGGARHLSSAAASASSTPQPSHAISSPLPGFSMPARPSQAPAPPPDTSSSIPLPSIPPSAALSAPSVTLSKERLDQLLDSEITHFAFKKQVSVSLRDILALNTPRDTARFIHEELPVRFAARLKQLESLQGYQDIPLLMRVKSTYSESFKQLRMSNWEDEREFTRVIQSVKKRHSHVVPQLVMGIRQLRNRDSTLTAPYVDTFLNTFFLSRIGTEMLSSHYIAVCRGHRAGIIDKSCDPIPIIWKAAQDAEMLCRSHYGICPSVRIWNQGTAIQFTYISQYLYYILFELAKNSMRAVVETALNARRRERVLASLKGEDRNSDKASLDIDYDDSLGMPLSVASGGGLEGQGGWGGSLDEKEMHLPPVQVVVAGDNEQVAIKISDEGGGIDPAAQEKIWSYLYSTATLNPSDPWAALTAGLEEPPPPRTPPNEQGNGGEGKMTAAERLRESQAAASEPKAITSGALPFTPAPSGATAGPAGGSRPPSPLAGFGCGLPLSRLYAQYLGGSLNVVSMPKWGTDAFLFLHRIGEVQESIPPTWTAPQHLIPSTSAQVFRTSTQEPQPRPQEATPSSPPPQSPAAAPAPSPSPPPSASGQQDSSKDATKANGHPHPELVQQATAFTLNGEVPPTTGEEEGGDGLPVEQLEGVDLDVQVEDGGKSVRCTVRGPDKRGVVATLTQVFANEGFSISDASIRTVEGKICDTFKLTPLPIPVRGGKGDATSLTRRLRELVGRRQS
ncbi:unnamed protein product [Vitrella brassicaformis CCMP3155]|uniref:Protein-serine/threonine kinase n=1 Tax=Vitrella brassicaformis (strain CCMP3155) TaxID=1169540 RepID=A0A0G4ES13_VITBC|nr:unnamed protein product [Vitrella brassicaformis CCMP3155]|eukprot:CEM00650.1 unnamed protein product [Vitrella brassicaformis CCMP3155]